MNFIDTQLNRKLAQLTRSNDKNSAMLRDKVQIYNYTKKMSRIKANMQ